MNKLHKISNQLAESSKQIQNGVSPENLVYTEKTEKNDKNSASETVLNKARQARFEEYRKSRRDLVTRLNSVLAQIQTEYEQITFRADSIRSQFQTLQEQLEQLDSAIPDAEQLVWSQSEFAEYWSKLEVVRLETIRAISRYQAMSQEKAESKNASGVFQGFHPEELTFRYLFRKGFAFHLPLLITLLLVAVIIALAFHNAFFGFSL